MLSLTGHSRINPASDLRAAEPAGPYAFVMMAQPRVNSGNTDNPGPHTSLFQSQS